MCVFCFYFNKIRLHRDGNMPRFGFEQIRQHHSPLERMIYESIMIKKSFLKDNTITMNNKLEYSRTILPDLLEDPISEMEMSAVSDIEDKIQLQTRIPFISGTYIDFI